QHGLHAIDLDHGTMPDTVRTRIREDLMQTAATPADIAGQQPPPKAHRRQPAAPFPHRSLPRMAWTGAANIALAAVLILAAFGAWRLMDGSVGTGGGTAPTEPSGGQYAQAPIISTPAATADTGNA